MIRKVRNVQILGFWRILGVLMGILSLYPHIWYLFGILGIWGVLLKMPSGWSGRSRMAKNLGFGVFWMSWWGFCHCTPIHNTFLESLGQGKKLGRVSRIFGHHQNDQEGQECPNTGVWGFWVSWWVVCHCTLTYDIFLESLGPGEYF